MYELPFTDLDFVASMLANDALVIPVRSEVFLLHGSVENRAQKLAVTVVSRRHARRTAEAKNVHRLQVESTRQLLRNREIEFRRMAFSIKR